MITLAVSCPVASKTSFLRRIVLPTAMSITSAWVGPAAYAQSVAGDDLTRREREALVACEGGDFKSGIDTLARLYGETLDTAYIYNQARCYQKSNLPQEAYAKFKEFLRVNKDPASEAAVRARTYVKEHDDEQAERRRQQAALAPAGMRTAAIVSGVVGVVGIGGGIFFGSRLRSKESDIEEKIRKDPNVDDATLKDDRDQGKRYETLQYLGFGVGAAALIAGGVLFYLSIPADVTEGPGRDKLVVAPLVGRGLMGAVLAKTF